MFVDVVNNNNNSGHSKQIISVCMFMSGGDDGAGKREREIKRERERGEIVCEWREEENCKELVQVFVINKYLYIWRIGEEIDLCV